MKSWKKRSALDVCRNRMRKRVRGMERGSVTRRDRKENRTREKGREELVTEMFVSQRPMGMSSGEKGTWAKYRSKFYFMFQRSQTVSHYAGNSGPFVFRFDCQIDLKKFSILCGNITVEWKKKKKRTSRIVYHNCSTSEKNEIVIKIKITVLPEPEPSEPFYTHFLSI